MNAETFNLGNPDSTQALIDYLDFLQKKQAFVRVEELRQTRTTAQNAALHLYFKFCAKELNNIGLPFVWRGLKGAEFEIMWTPNLFKQFVWKQIQMTLFNTESTTELKRNEIDPIYETISKFFADRGVEIRFPNRFDYFLEQYQKRK